MALPTSSQIQTLDYTDWSLPVVYVDAKTGINSSTLDFTDWSLPVVGLSVSGGGGGGGDPTNVVYIKTDSGWQTATNIYINVSGTWQEIDSISIKTDSGWNS